MFELSPKAQGRGGISDKDGRNCRMHLRNDWGFGILLESGREPPGRSSSTQQCLAKGLGL